MRERQMVVKDPEEDNRYNIHSKGYKSNSKNGNAKAKTLSRQSVLFRKWQWYKLLLSVRMYSTAEITQTVHRNKLLSREERASVQHAADKAGSFPLRYAKQFEQ